MKYIYINTVNNSVSIKNKKNRLIKKYENISRNNIELLNSTKLLIFALNKIFVMDKNHYNDEEYIFNISDEKLITYLKTEYDFFYEKINKDWKNELDNKTLSELGRLLSLLNKIPFKNVLYWIEDEEYIRNEKYEKYAKMQSEYDEAIQKLLHHIQGLKDKELESDYCISLIKEIRRVRLEREKVKKEIRKIDKGE